MATVTQSTTVDRALARVMSEIHEGLRHGYFEYTLTCEMIGGQRRRLQLRAGKNYQFDLPADECERSTGTDDLCDEGAVKL